MTICLFLLDKLHFCTRLISYIHIGKIVATHALKGNVILSHVLNSKSAISKLQTIFLQESPKTFLPYFIESAKPKSLSEAILKFEDIDNLEAARSILKKDLWVTEEVFRSLNNKQVPVSLLGYQVVQEGKNLGEIEEVIEQPQQLLCKLMMDELEVLIPLHEETIVKIDRQKRIVYVQLPHGLLDIYLGR